MTLGWREGSVIKSWSEKEFSNLAVGHQIARVLGRNFPWEMTASIPAELFA